MKKKKKTASKASKLVLLFGVFLLQTTSFAESKNDVDYRDAIEKKLANSKFAVVVCIYNWELKNTEFSTIKELHREVVVVKVIKGSVQFGKKTILLSHLKNLSEEKIENFNLKKRRGQLKLVFSDVWGDTVRLNTGGAINYDDYLSISPEEGNKSGK